jgi:uncharacterized membrane protein
MGIVLALHWLSAKPRIMALYILCALPLGMFTAIVTPPGQVPDEPAHMARAAGLLHGAVLAERKSPDTTGVMVDAGLFRVAFGQTTTIVGRNLVTLANLNAIRSEPPSHARMFAAIPNTATYFPAAYLPATIGLAFGLLFRISPFDCMILARLCMLGTVLLLGSLALRVAAYGEALLLCILLLPMTIFLAGSLNEDGVLIGLGCLSAAAFTRNLSDEARFRWVALLPLMLILCCKPPYLPLLGLALLPLTAAGFWRRVLDMALAAAPVIIWVVLIAAFVVVPFGMPPYHPGPLFAGDPSIILQHTDPHRNLHILLAEPGRFFSLPWRLLRGSGRLLLCEMIGYLGLLDLIFPWRFYLAWTIALLAALLGLVVAERQRNSSARNAILQSFHVLLLLVLSVWAVTISLYLSWSLVGSATIEGVQGRYFLVLLPFLLLAVPHWRRCNIPAIAPALPAIALGIYDLGYVPMKIVSFFYIY